MRAYLAPMIVVLLPERNGICGQSHTFLATIFWPASPVLPDERGREGLSHLTEF